MVVFDSNFLLFLLQENLPAPQDPATGQPVTDCKKRIAYLVSELRKSKNKIVIPTPVLSEILVRAGAAAPDYVTKFNKSAAFKIEPFDTVAAIEVALMTAAAQTGGRGKKDGIDAPWTKVKYDRQIVAIAVVHNANAIYTNDENLKKLALSKNIKAIGVHELDLPPEDTQRTFPFDIDEQQIIADLDEE
jgi:rRNA-processing protein FCF1